MTIAFQSERRRGLFVLQLARAGDYEAATLVGRLSSFEFLSFTAYAAPPAKFS